MRTRVSNPARRGLMWLFAACLAGVATAAWLGTAASAAPVTFTNAAAIAIPAVGTSGTARAGSRRC